jgi:hypothetical protein
LFALLVWYVTDEFLTWFKIWRPLPGVLAALTFVIAAAAALFARPHVRSLPPPVKVIAGGFALVVVAFVLYVSIVFLDLWSDWFPAPFLLAAGWGGVAYALVASGWAHRKGVIQSVAAGGVGIAIGFAAARILQPDAELSPGAGRGEPPPPLTDWAVGDVHVHAAGDRNLIDHPDCKVDEPADSDEYLPPDECAEQLVRITLGAARDNEADWIILVEHGAWLGFKSLTNYDPDQGTSEWNDLKVAANELSPRFGVRTLMGEELGTAGASFAGHSSAYQIDDYVPNSYRRVPDSEYVQNVDRTGGWGSVNHPFEGGNAWDCWYPRDGRRCGLGAVGFAERLGTPKDLAAFRALELTNGGDFARAETVAKWDELLVQGYKVWPVGGSDAHTRSRTTGSLVHLFTGQPNIGKILRSRTFVYVGETDVAPQEGFDSTDEADPIRSAIYDGRVVASNGPFAAATLNGALPGSTVEIADGGDVQLTLNLRWPEQFTSKELDPREIRVVLAEIQPGCSEACQPDSIESFVPAADANDQVLQLDYPASMDSGYVRVEVIGRAGDRELGAFVAPIFVVRSE